MASIPRHIFPYMFYKSNFLSSLTKFLKEYVQIFQHLLLLDMFLLLDDFLLYVVFAISFTVNEYPGSYSVSFSALIIGT